MTRLSLFLAALTLTPASAQTIHLQAARLPYVTLSAPGYAVRAEVRGSATTPSRGPDSVSVFQSSPAQVRVLLKAHKNLWQAQYPGQLPPASYVAVTPVQNWQTLYKLPDMREMALRQLNQLRAVNAGQLTLEKLRRQRDLPHLPLSDSAQVVSGAAHTLNTAQFQGVRYLAIYAQGDANYSRYSVLYTFQGLSRDGRYVVSVQLPYAPASFPVKETGALPGGMSLEAYIQQANRKLDAENANLAALDRLVQSVRIR